ncbi:MAG: sulfatase-like hydrolase/transferase, partial [Armatimonadota bacterium]
APRNGVYNVGSLSRGAANPKLTPPAQSTSIRAEAITFAETLKSAGYVTAHVGKFHVSATPEAIKTQHGFDVNYGGGAKGEGGSAGYFAVPAGNDRTGAWRFTNMGPKMAPFATPYTAEYIERSLRPWAKGNDPATLVGTPKHLTDAQGDAALDFLDRYRSGTDRDKPFFLNVAFNAVHTAIRPRPDLAAKYAKLPLTDPRHTNRDYAALIDQLDQTAGRILARLDDPNGDGDKGDSIAANTLVLFVSDNGGFAGATVNTPLRGAKGMFSEGGIRVPMIARWPGAVPAGATSAAAVHLVDLYPTLTTVAGAKMPDTKAQPLDGVSLAAVLRGQEKTPAGRDSLYWHFPGYLDTRAVPCSVIVKDRKEEGRRFKLLYFYED